MRARANMLRSGWRRMAVMAAAASVIALAAGAGKAPAAEQADPSRETLIQRIDVQRATGKTTIHAIAGRPILYSAIPQENPPALILNLTGTRLAKGVGPIAVKDALVQDILVTQATTAAAARIAVTGAAGARFEVHPAKDGLVVTVTSSKTAPAGAQASRAPGTGPIAATAASGAAASALSRGALPRAKALMAITADKGTDGTDVRLRLDGRIAKYDSTIVPNPSRIVVDLWNLANVTGKKEFRIASSDVAQVRIGKHPEKVRVVVDLAGGEKPYAVARDGESLVIAVGPRARTLASRVATDRPSIAAAGPVGSAQMQVASAEPARTDLVVPALAQPEPVLPADEPVVSALAKPAPSPMAASLADQKADQAEEARMLAPEVSMGFRPGKVYTGRLMSLDFKDADVQNILRLIAEVSGMNVVAGDDVTGKVTVRLVNVPWDQALDIVLASRALGYVRSGNILRVAPAERLKAEEAAMLADRRSKEKLEDLVVKLQPVNYAKASEVQPQIESLLSDRGSVNIDTRTNTMIIKDIPTVIDQAVALVRRLDTRTPQVLIEAKIIEANLDFAKELGISYTADFLNPDIASGQNASSRNLDFGNRVVNSGTPLSGSSLAAGALPIKGTPTGVVAASFTALKDALDVDVVVQALEASGHGRVISSPRITTLDNKEARIEQGVSIPFQTTEEGDTNLEFIDANLSLTVTPHVTSDNSIIMKIKVARNAPDTSIPTSTGDPAIAKNEATTEALVRDGETIVIGGIYVIDKSVTSQSIPYFNRIPGVQWLFRNYIAKDNKKELIIFVTPRIVGQDTA